MFVHKYDSIISMENLLATWEKFLPGKKYKKDVIKFQLELGENIANLHNLLASRTYEHDAYSAFNISDPKPRNIHKATVRDRLLHHLIYKELYPYFDKKFIYDSYSCRENKGVHNALDRFRYFAGKVSKNNTRTCYILKCDIKKFFASIDQAILLSILDWHIEDMEFKNLIKKVISSFSSTRVGTGLPLGNLTSQLLVNIYMHELDIHLKQKLKVKYYIRYADDFVVMSDNRKYLEDIPPRMQSFLKEKLKLVLHDDKIHIRTYHSGTDFLGWVHFPYHRQIRTSTKQRISRRLKGYPRRQTVNSYRGLLSHGNTFKIRKNLELF